MTELLRALRSTTFQPLLLATLLTLGAAIARADADWFESGDTLLRLDLQLLNDAEVIRLPITHWPLPRATVRHALAEAKERPAMNVAVSTALARVRARVDRSGGARLTSHAGIAGGEPGLWRDFDTLAREQGELNVGLEYDTSRFSADLSLTAVKASDDGNELRADGSHLTFRLGNWLLSANTLDRWWGPGHQGSLILSNNARPMPNLMVERVEPRAFQSRWLDWLGPWRFNFGIGRMEGSRQDIDAPLFMSWRVVVMPFRKIELGFSRTAQFCGEQLECNLDVFGNMLAGNDNVGIDATPENEPGNQMAGFDIRWTSPIGNLPYAVYGQYIGEDESSYLPAKYLGQLGVEVWKPFNDGSVLQGFVEYASTAASANSSSGPYYNSAYNQGRFNVEGYRYRGRVVGHTSDRDAENWAVGAIYAAAGGSTWTATARSSRLNRDDFGDFRNTVASVPTSYHALEMGWKGRLAGAPLSVDLGVESIEPAGGDRDVEPFGFIGWRHDF
jgi:hypothetical protein